MRMSIGAVGMVLVGTVTETPSKAPSLFMTLPPRERRLELQLGMGRQLAALHHGIPVTQGEGEREVRTRDALDRDGHGRPVGDHREHEQVGILRQLDPRRQGDVKREFPSFTASTWASCACAGASPSCAAEAAFTASPRWRSCCFTQVDGALHHGWRVEPFSSSGSMACQRARAVWKSSFCSAMKAWTERASMLAGSRR